ncbi:MAG: DUF2461 domain-containing protein [Paludibacteraceae bacterium]|nr:DUF2461 domain-containing protein [Paludibacteraceae bacterium]
MNVSNMLNFLRSLKENNNREWFAANKAWYEACKIDFDEMSKMLILEIATFDPEISNLNARDCVFRIYRDTRFSKDKTPYKTHFGVFIAEGGRKSERAGYYLHIEPGNGFLASGVWCPPSALLKSLRKSIFDNIDELNEIRNEDDFKNTFDRFFDEDKLKTVPAGFPKDFPDGDLLKLKHYMVEFKLDDDFLQRNDLLQQLANVFRRAYPFNRFLNYAVDEYKGRV